MKYVRNLGCFLCLLLLLAVLPGRRLYASETEPEQMPDTIQTDYIPAAAEDVRTGDSQPEPAGMQESPAETSGMTQQEDTGSNSVQRQEGEKSGEEESTSDHAGSIKPEAEPAPETESGPEMEEMQADPMFGLKPGEEITISVRKLFGGDAVLLAAADSDSDTVKVKVLEVYYYDHAGLGDGTGMFTNKYQVTFNGVRAIAYCLDPAKANPKMSDNFSIGKYNDGQSVAKILYYAQADAEHGGYFALKHPGYSDEKQFIITHMAAAKAAGSSSWDQHATSAAKSEANSLILYAESMPAIQDPAISFSPSSAAAALQGNVLQTGQITLKGSEGNTAEVTLPGGVTLKNRTSDSRSGTGKVTIDAGDTFVLTYPAGAKSGLSVTVSAVGAQDRDYSAYRIKTDSDTQNLGLVFGEGITGENKTSLRVQITPEVRIRPLKTDKGSGHGLQGAVFGLYAADNMTEADGKTRKKDERIGTATTGADGRAEFSYALTAGLNYYVKEDKAPAGYLLNTETRMPVIFRVTGGSTSVQTIEGAFRNEPVKGEIRLHKTDRELAAEGTDDAGTSAQKTETGPDGTETEENHVPQVQGDATLEGALYGLYARENILRPDQSGTVLYPAGGKVAEAVTDAEGQIVWEDLPLGKYTVKEISPPEGYVLDETEYKADLVYENDHTGIVSADVNAQEQVIRQPFALTKLSVKNDSDPRPLKGAGFKAWLVRTVKTDGNSYDVSEAQPVPLCQDGTDELFTDEEGKAVSVPLPYGTYVVRETTVPENHLKAEEFLISITEHNPDQPQNPVVLTDTKVQGKIRVVKTGPMLTGYNGHEFIYKVRGLAGAVFEITAGQDIFRTDGDGYENGDPVLLYQAGQEVASITTDSSGEAVSEELPMGKYVVREITAPYGTVLDTESYEVELKSDAETPVVVKDLQIEDPKQEISVDVRKISGDERQTPLAGAEFTLYAGEDIRARSEDGQTPGKLLVKAGEALSKAVSGKGGKASFKLELPNARYYVKETKAPSGYQLNRKQYECDCRYEDQMLKTLQVSLEIPDEPLSGTMSGSSLPGSSAPKTGDGTPLPALLEAMLGAAAAAGFIILLMLRRRQR